MVTKPVVFENTPKREILAAGCIIRPLFAACYLVRTFSLAFAFVIARTKLNVTGNSNMTSVPVDNCVPLNKYKYVHTLNTKNNNKLLPVPNGKSLKYHIETLQ